MTWSVSISAQSHSDAKVAVEKQVSPEYPEIRALLVGMIDAGTKEGVSISGSGYRSGDSVSCSISASFFEVVHAAGEEDVAGRTDPVSTAPQASSSLSAATGAASGGDTSTATGIGTPTP